MKTHHSIGRLWIENHDKYQNYFNGNGGDKIYWLGHNGRKEEISKTDPRIDEELRKYGIRPCGGVSARRLVSPLWGLRLDRLAKIASRHSKEYSEPAVYIEAEPTLSPPLATHLFPVQISVDNINPSPGLDAIHYQLPPPWLRRSILDAQLTISVFDENDIEIYHAVRNYDRKIKGESLHFGLIYLEPGSYRVEAQISIDYLDVNGAKAHEDNAISQLFLQPGPIIP